MCIIADMKANPDDLLVLLEVSRSAKFTTAAKALGLKMGDPYFKVRRFLEQVEG